MHGLSRFSKVAVVGLALVAATAFAAKPAEAQSLGIKAGLDLAKANGSVDLLGDGTGLSFKNKSGFVGGVYARFMQPDSSFGVQLEANYLKRNTELDLSGLAAEFGDAGFELSTDYLEVPVLLKLYPSPGGSVRFNVYAGGAVAFRLRAKTTERLFGTVTEIDVKEDTKPVDFAIPLGIGLDLGKALNFDVRYTIGLTQIDDSQDDPIDAKWRTWAFTLGYTF